MAGWLVRSISSAAVTTVLTALVAKVFDRSALTDLADRLRSGADLTYTATYQVADGRTTDRVTVARTASNLAVVRGDRRYIVTPAVTWICQTRQSCRRLPGNPIAEPLVKDVAKTIGSTIVTPGAAAALLGIVVGVSRLKTETSSRTIARERSHCVTVNGLPSSLLETAGLPAQSVPRSHLTMCVTDSGVLSELLVRHPHGKTHMTMTKYTAGFAAADAFRPPPGARVMRRVGCRGHRPRRTAATPFR